MPYVGNPLPVSVSDFTSAVAVLRVRTGLSGHFMCMGALFPKLQLCGQTTLSSAQSYFDKRRNRECVSLAEPLLLKSRGNSLQEEISVSVWAFKEAGQEADWKELTH